MFNCKTTYGRPVIVPGRARRRQARTSTNVDTVTMMNRRHPLSSTFQSACRDSFRRSARLISSDLFDDTSCQTAGRAQFRAPSPQIGQQRLAFGIDEGHACQIDHHAPWLSDGYPTKTGAQLIDPWTGQASLKSQQGSVRFRASLFGNLQHVRWTSQPLSNLLHRALQDSFTALQADERSHHPLPTFLRR